MAKKTTQSNSYSLSVDLFKKPEDVEKKLKDYSPSEDDMIKMNYVKTRFSAMQWARTAVDRDWDTYQTMIDAIFEPYPDERSSSVVPIASSIIELYVAEAIKIPTEFNLRAKKSKYATQNKILDYVWKEDWRVNCRLKTMNYNEYIAAGFGTAIIYSWYKSYNKKQMDMVMGKDGMPERKENTIEVKDIIMDNIDIRNFWVDNTVVDDISQAADCYYRQWIGFEQFQNLKNSIWYKNIEYVKPRWYSSEYKTFTTKEESVKQWDFVLVENYRNVEKDCYMVIANDVLVRETPIPTTIDGVKCLPFTVRILGKKNFSIWGRGICENLMMFNSELNDLRELLMDAIRRSNTQTLAIWNGLTFNGRTFEYDNEILTFNGEFGNNFQQISWNPPNQAIFSYMNEIYKSIAIFTGIDIQNIIWNPQQTAFQTEVQREASQKRVNVWFTNRDLAFERLANIHKDLLVAHYPIQDKDGNYPEIETDWEELVGKWDTAKFIKKKWWVGIMEITPKILRGDWTHIDAFTNINNTTINAVDKAQRMDFLKSIGEFSQSIIMAKNAGIDLEEVLPLKKTIRDLAEWFNIDTADKTDNEDVKEAKNKLVDDIQRMAWWISWQQQEPQPTAPNPTAPQALVPNPMI